jgi:hypothetical protein
MNAGTRILSVFAILACACTKPQEPAPPVAERPPGMRPAQTLAVPETVTDSAGPTELSWSVPAGWVQQTPSSGMRRAQFRVPGPGGDGECVVFYFGARQGGDAQANARRWAGQFTQPDGRPSAEVMQTRALDLGGRVAQLVEVTGTYDGGMTMTDEPAQPRPGSMLLGAIVDGPDAPWFFKFTGPESTVRAQREAFIGLLRSLRPPA